MNPISFLNCSPGIVHVNDLVSPTSCKWSVRTRRGWLPWCWMIGTCEQSTTLGASSSDVLPKGQWAKVAYIDAHKLNSDLIRSHGHIHTHSTCKEKPVSRARWPQSIWIWQTRQTKPQVQSGAGGTWPPNLTRLPKHPHPALCAWSSII